jgi:hypothetical protein
MFHHADTRRFILALCLVPALGCASAITLTRKPSQPEPAELVPVPQLKEHAYKRILLLPPQGPVAQKDIEVEAVREKQTTYFTARLEKTLLQKGFQVISPEIVARAEQGAKAEKTLSTAEKAMIMGKKTAADAVFMVQSIEVRGLSDHYTVEGDSARRVEPGLVRADEDGVLYHAETEACLFRLPYYSVRIQAKLIDASSGNVLWVGNVRQTSTDVMRQDWNAVLNHDCETKDQNFIYTDYLAANETLDKTVEALLERMLSPLQQDAATGKTMVREEKAAPPPPPPKVKTAIVASKRASLRDGPGTKNPRKMSVPRKAKVEVVETMGEWIKVKVQDGTVGWMHESTLIMSE